MSIIRYWLRTVAADWMGIIIGLVILAVVLCFLPSGARAHDQYSPWMSPSGGSCCTGDEKTGDCRPVAGAWQDDDGVWHVPGEGVVVITIPWRAIVHYAKDGRCHLCEKGGHVYCFNPCDPKI